MGSLRQHQITAGIPPSPSQNGERHVPTFIIGIVCTALIKKADDFPFSSLLPLWSWRRWEERAILCSVSLTHSAMHNIISPSFPFHVMALQLTVGKSPVCACENYVISLEQRGVVLDQIATS